MLKLAKYFGYFGICLAVLAVFLLVLNSTPVVVANPTPKIFEVYFLTLNAHGQLIAYVPGQSGIVKVEYDHAVSTQVPRVEVATMTEKRLLGNKKDEFVAWGYGATLFVRDREQLESLIVR